MLEAETTDKTAPRGRLSAVKPALEGEKREGGVRLVASGDWLARTVGEMESLLAETARSDLGRQIIVDCSRVGRIDTAGAFVLERLSRDLQTDGRNVELAGIADRNEALFQAVRGAMEKEAPTATPARTNPVTELVGDVGRGVFAVFNEAVAALNIIGGAIYGAAYRLTGRTRNRPAAVFNQIDQMGVKAIPIIVLITFLIGGIIAQQGAFQLRRFGGEVYAVNLVGILVLREIGVLLTAIMIAGRSGSAITAELGSMKMREEIDALHVIGLNPISVLVFPRLVALTIALPLLTVLANISALAGGMLTLKLYSDISYTNYLQGIQNSVDLFTVFSGLIKAPFMAIAIGIIGALEGMKVGGSAESLGLRVTSSVVKSIFIVIVMDGLFAIFYASIGL
ncbi:ABC transporter permease [Jiella mangrovi]|uniref:MlaE family lipid ABC transporter permease subunit n=1 Tax=Jiella mangrovi TaxID=2821407 RepID=A0ABS4BF60_9HYPH|nr:MlaE family lipid ABC transporter permease subunit [Jiella mangrovi]MBP0615383.1 MlaE family lipid ABC transporter permease subunit [Jiella mangrovi]